MAENPSFGHIMSLGNLWSIQLPRLVKRCLPHSTPAFSSPVSASLCLNFPRPIVRPFGYGSWPCSLSGTFVYSPSGMWRSRGQDLISSFLHIPPCMTELRIDPTNEQPVTKVFVLKGHQTGNLGNACTVVRGPDSGYALEPVSLQPQVHWLSCLFVP